MLSETSVTKLCQNDISINKLIRRYYSVLVLIDAKPNDQGLPPEVYIAVEEVHDDGSPTSKTFEHVPSETGRRKWKRWAWNTCCGT
ncbi:hypothetical protein quinque_008092 [Culex quinquefasciatus]